MVHHLGQNNAPIKSGSNANAGARQVRPGRIDFRYRVDAELGYDFLRVIVRADDD